jgi:hypothetical protein
MTGFGEDPQQLEDSLVLVVDNLVDKTVCKAVHVDDQPMARN